MEELRGRSLALSSKSPKKKGPVVPLPSAPLSLSLDITDSDEEDGGSDEASSDDSSESSETSSDSDFSDMDSFDTAQVVARRKVLAGAHGPPPPTTLAPSFVSAAFFDAPSLGYLSLGLRRLH